MRQKILIFVKIGQHIILYTITDTASCWRGVEAVIPVLNQYASRQMYICSKYDDDDLLGWVLDWEITRTITYLMIVDSTFVKIATEQYDDEHEEMITHEPREWQDWDHCWEFNSVNVEGERDPIKLSSHLHHGRMVKQHWVYWSSNKRLTTLFGTKANKRLTSLLGIMIRWDFEMIWKPTRGILPCSAYTLRYFEMRWKPTRGILPCSAYTLRWDFTITNKRFTSLFGANIVDDNFTDLMTTNKRLLPCSVQTLMMRIYW